MKKILYILICLTLIFSSCKKEDESPNSVSTNNTSASIVGGWDFTELHSINTQGYYLGGFPNGTKIITDSQDEISLPGDTSWAVQSVNWTFSTDSYMIETFIYNDGDSEVFNKSYEKSGNTLILDTNTILSIITLSSSKLTVNNIFEDTNTYWDPNNDTVYFYEDNSTIKWDRSSLTTDNSTSKRIQSNKNSFFKTFIDRRKKDRR